MTHNYTQLKDQQQGLLDALKGYYKNPEQHAQAIEDAKKELRQVEAALSRGREEEELKKPEAERKTYAPELGAPATENQRQASKEFNEKTGRDQALSDPNSKPSDAYHSYAADCEKKPDGATRKSHLDSIIKSDISGKEPYYSAQVEALLNDYVPVGEKELSTRINAKKSSGEQAFTLGYLRVDGNGKDALENHFYALNFSKQNDGHWRVIAVDPNGDPIEPKEQQLLQKLLGKDMELQYIGHDGKLVAAKDATPSNLMRLQFDDTSCGMYTANIASAFAKNGHQYNPLLAQDLALIRDTDTATQRKQHQQLLQNSQSIEPAMLLTQMQSKQISSASTTQQSIEPAFSYTARVTGTQMVR